MAPFRWLPRNPEPAAPPPDAPAPAGDAWAALREMAGPPKTARASAPAPEPPPSVVAPQRRRQLAETGALRTVQGSACAYAGPSRIEYADILSPADLGMPAVPHRLRLYQPMMSAPPAPLFDADALPHFIRGAHEHRPMAPAVDIYGVPGHELGAAGLLQQDGRVFVNAAVQPAYINDAARPEKLRLPEVWLGALLKPDAEIIETDVPVGVALHPNLIYGHFLLEMLPRLHLLSRLRMYGRKLPVALPSDAPKWVRPFVSLYFDEAEIIEYRSRLQRVRAPCFILPGMMTEDSAFHPETNALVEELVARTAGPHEPPADQPRRLYLSRSRHHRTWRGMDNEAEVEAMLTDLGFAVIHPQELPIARQLALYAGAECIVCEFGSAAHNALFAPRGTPVFCIGWLQNSQSRIAALRGQPLAYMAPREGFLDPTKPRAEPEFRFSVDCAELARRLAAFLEFAGARRD